MAIIRIESRKNKADLSRFIEEGIARRLRLEGAFNVLKDYIQDTIEIKAQVMFICANLMLESSKNRQPKTICEPVSALRLPASTT
ncbi:hypothetical protein EJ02DRAFT_88273 [Clathrospora elynae]|uniref:Uncharacterized protein n=1 Tax=Clathrospora elynae TaxID=706981 RepID=A0A6A5S6N7_9PLEO|nr:hypothetical protein EJ02DRAFT_88273 [Clathrospora elynae]